MGSLVYEWQDNLSDIVCLTCMMVVQTGLFDLFGLYTPLRMLICVAVVCTMYCKRVSLAESRPAERDVLHGR